MHGKRTIRPTKFWSQEFPDATEIDALCRLKINFVTPDCYEDGEKYFALIADADYVEVISPHVPHLPTYLFSSSVFINFS